VRRRREDGRTGAFGLLADRNFGPFFFGNLLSNCGTWFQTLAQSLLVYRLTGSTVMLGVVNFAQFAGVFVLAPWAGSAADRFDRRRLLVATQLAATAVTGLLALLAALDLATAAVVIGLALLLGVTTAFASPAMLALVPALVARERLGAAVALNSVTFNFARAIGPILGAVVVSALGIAAAFALNSLSYLALVAALAVIRPRPIEVEPKRRARLRDSLRTVRRTPRLMILFGIVAVVGVSVDPVTTLSPVFATEVFGRADTLAGFLIGAFGAGAVVGAFTIASRAEGGPGRMAITLGLLGLGLAAFALAPTPGAASAALFVAGLGFLSSNAAATTRLQLSIDEAERGRMMALWSIAFLGVRPLASLVDGALASLIGVRGAALVFSLPALGAAVAVLVTRRRFE
jgi:MFS family permease